APGDREVGRTERQDLFGERHRVAKDVQCREVEADSPERAVDGVDQVSAVDVLRLASGSNQRLLLAGFQVEDGDLAVEVGQDDREEDPTAAWQHGWKRVAAFALGLRLGQPFRFAAAGGDAKDAGSTIARGENNRVVLRPARSPRSAAHRANHDGRTAARRYLL